MQKLLLSILCWLAILSSATYAQGPIACYPLDGGNTFESIQGLHGAVYGYAAAGRDGRANGAARLNCPSGIVLGNHMQLKQPYMTILLWVWQDPNCTIGGPTKPIINLINDETQRGIYSMYNFVFSRHLEASAGAPNVNNIVNIPSSAPNSYQKSIWQQVGISFDLDSVYLILNGELRDSAPRSVVPYDSLGNIVLGYTDGGSGGFQTFGGMMDDVQFYDRVLSGAELMALYQAPSGCVLSGLSGPVEEGKTMLYPNPTDGSVWASHPEELEFVRCQLFDIGGRLLKEEILNSTKPQIGLQGLARGSYLLLLTDEAGKVSRHKVIKQD